jgi:hypothetical protein
MTPVDPPKNAIGRNTAASTIAMAISALDVLDDDDRVVDEEADCQHHSKQGESVDAEPGDAHHSESAQQHDRDGDGGDEGRADVLQKQEHDEEYEDHRLEEGLDDLL